MFHTKGLIRRAMLAAMAAVAVLSGGRPAQAEDLNVRFSWKLKGEYGFFYLGQEKGLYQNAGVTLKLGEGAGSQAALGSLIQGQEDAVVLPGIFAISAIQKGMPVKIIALYQPETPVVLISHPNKPVNTPKELEGKTIASAVGETGTAYLGVFCKINQVDCSKLSKIQMDAQARIPQFLQNRVDVVSVYTSSDLPVIEEKTGTRYPVLNMAQYGLAIPGLAVVASNAGIEKKAAALRGFLAANAKAIALTRSDPAAATAALKTVWQAGPSDQVVQKQIEAASLSFRSPDDKPAGWIDEKAMADALKLLGAVEDVGTPKPIATFYTNQLLQ
ncbi:ABC transporter substrate-binding protein [Labrys sp. ZIDIC5]|uniref:ABC transporter substrate-binding protein n=1 Tax=Labrys sedimenti TaxID=3106036 RepID=UPI002ACAE56A|nr:ABC transporter substrate-binding protein [Labrys sp. ZIDIC5]MDZ5454357.1 ABC transporter substrate-binding protein [Labrys sp. ZIDIC5]